MRYKTCILVLFAVVAAPILAQTATVDIEAEMAAAQLKFEEWLASTNAFIGSTTFNEDDIRSFIELWPELAAIDEEEDDEEEVDYEEMLSDPRYREFAETHGLVAESWFKKSVRILTLVMKEQMATHLAAAEAQLPQQLQMIEEQRAQYGEETYQTMKRSLEASTEMMKMQRKAWAGMPDPTASERALLETYRGELAALMMGEDEEEEWAEEEWEDEESDGH
jgi:hypothetical protein